MYGRLLKKPWGVVLFWDENHKTLFFLYYYPGILSASNESKWLQFFAKGPLHSISYLVSDWYQRIVNIKQTPPLAFWTFWEEQQVKWRRVPVPAFVWSRRELRNVRCVASVLRQGASVAGVALWHCFALGFLWLFFKIQILHRKFWTLDLIMKVYFLSCTHCVLAVCQMLRGYSDSQKPKCRLSPRLYLLNFSS